MFNDLDFAPVPECHEGDPTDLSSGFVQRVAAAEINNIAVTDDDPVVPVPHIDFDTGDLQMSLNLEMFAGRENDSKVASSFRREEFVAADWG